MGRTLCVPIPLRDLVEEWELSECLSPAASALAPRVWQFISLEGGERELRFINVKMSAVTSQEAFSSAEIIYTVLLTAVLWVIPPHAQVEH